jgi:NAD(P)-dependent dehydrogenase (short-subunit alcohol dehydrogenase family)
MLSKSLELFSMRGRIAVVAGASRGIGAAIAEGLAGAGASVFSCARSPQPSEFVPGVTYRRCDVNDVPEFTKFCDAAAEGLGRIDSFVFAAGITIPSKDGQTIEDFSLTIATDLIAAYKASSVVSPWMRSGSSMIFVTSINSTLGFAGNPGYVAAKGGLRQLTKALAMDFGPRGIRVNALAPGYIRTRMTEASFADPEQQSARTGRTILGRWGDCADLIGAAVFLASEASAYVTGHELAVDGGWTARGL